MTSGHVGDHQVGQRGRLQKWAAAVHASGANRCRERVDRLLGQLEAGAFGQLGHERQLAARSERHAGAVQLVVVQIRYGMHAADDVGGACDHEAGRVGSGDRAAARLERLVADEERDLDGPIGQLEVVQLLHGLLAVLGVRELNVAEAFAATEVVARQRDRVNLHLRRHIRSFVCFFSLVEKKSIYRSEWLEYAA